MIANPPLQLTVLTGLGTCHSVVCIELCIPEEKMSPLHNHSKSERPGEMEDNARDSVPEQHMDDDEEWCCNLKENFVIQKYITKGSYGRIFKIQENSSNLFYALKVISRFSKDELDEVDELQKLREKRIMETIESYPFLVKLHSSFTTPLHIVLIMDYIDGISLADYVESLDACTLPEGDAAFYIAETSLALHFLHKNGIIHRDVKVDNIMIDVDGHVKLIDFGGAKDGLGFGVRTSTLICSEFNAAPEIFSELSYTFMVDWYALGIVLCLMLTSDHPFISLVGRCSEEITLQEYKNMISAIQKKEFHLKKDVSSDAFSLLQRLLEADPKKRMGSCDSADEMEIKQHVFLNEIDWTMLEEKKAKPPFIPKVENARVKQL
ncbi:protein kinase C zeta type-like [Planococcus citri]|uniref:protein kinase C zeta type-like n=1 Tax=Planococcus citri TaxID=170843 RepID=UPI0031FA45DB